MTRNTHDRLNDHFGTDKDTNVVLDGAIFSLASASGLHAALVALIGGGLLQLLSTISPSQITGNTDNWNPTGLTNATWIRASTDASRNLTGLVAPSSPPRAILLTNVGSQNLVIKHDVTSTSGNRFLCPGSTDYTLTPNSSVMLFYDSTSSRWRLLV